MSAIDEYAFSGGRSFFSIGSGGLSERHVCGELPVPWQGHRQVKMQWLGRVGSEGYCGGKTTSRDPIYAGYRYPAEIISDAVWLYFRFPLSLRRFEEMLAAREIGVSHETVRQWGLKFGEVFARRVRQRAPQRGDKWHLDEVVITIAGRKHWLWRAVDQQGFVLDVLV
jgi:putative transposase